MCECGLASEDTKHSLQCSLLVQPCSLDNLFSVQLISEELCGTLQTLSLLIRTRITF